MADCWAAVTGSSRGLGSALVEGLLSRGWQVLGIARQTNNSLLQKYAGLYRELHLDLSRPAAAAAEWELCLQGMQGSWSRMCLINNAGMVGPIGRLDRVPWEELADNISLNLTAPLLLNALFSRYSKGKSSDRRVIQISSGAGRRPVEGWSAYCAAKAGLDHLSRVMQLECLSADPSLRVCSLAPGIIDTGMQGQIRQSRPEDFPDLQRFLDYKSQGDLADPRDTAEHILRHFVDGPPAQEVIADIREYL